MKHVALERPITFLDQVYLGCTRRECEPTESLVDDCRKIIESRILAAATKKRLFDSGKSERKYYRAVLRHGKTRNEMHGTVQPTRHTKNMEQLYKVSAPYVDEHQFKKEELETVGKLSKVCSQIVLKCLYLVNIGRS